MQTRFKLIKKSLALFVAVALCLSALVMTASAATDVTGTATVNVTYPKGFSKVIIGGTVNVAVELKGTNANKVAAALFELSAPGFVIESIYDQYTGYSLESNAWNDEKKIIENLSAAKFLVLSEDISLEKIPDSMTVNVTLKMVNSNVSKISVSNIEAASAGNSENASLKDVEEDITIASVESEDISVGIETSDIALDGNMSDVGLKVGFNYTVNGTVDEKGIYFYEGTTDPKVTGENNAAVNGHNSIYINGFSLINMATEYTFVPYVKSGNEYFYGTEAKYSYIDYLATKVSSTEALNSTRTTVTKGEVAKSILDAHYAVVQDKYNVSEYADKKLSQKIKGATYNLKSGYEIITNTPEGSFDSEATFVGSITNLALVLGFSGEADTDAEKKVTVKDPSGNGLGEATLSTKNGMMQIMGFRILDMASKYQFTPHWSVSGTDKTGTTSDISYASYLIDKVNGNNENTANRALTILDMLEKITGNDIYESVGSAE